MEAQSFIFNANLIFYSYSRLENPIFFFSCQAPSFSVWSHLFKFIKKEEKKLVGSRKQTHNLKGQLEHHHDSDTVKSIKASALIGHSHFSYALSLKFQKLWLYWIGHQIRSNTQQAMFMETVQSNEKQNLCQVDLGLKFVLTWLGSSR